MSEWQIFHGTPGSPHDEAQRLGDLVPPWRRMDTSSAYRAQTYIPSKPEIDIVNAALYLRRPLLLTGPPGSGKSSLAYAIAEELKLGPVLKWPINSRSTLLEGLYGYDAIARLRDTQRVHQSEVKGVQSDRSALTEADEVSRYLQLNWLGTALASPTPRVVLIDEIDKADIDLPNDMLHVLEEGTFAIPELTRVAEEYPSIEIRTCDLQSAQKVTVNRGVVTARSFPIIVLTSNGEREMPLALHRRCLRLQIEPPDKERLTQIVWAHLKNHLPGDEAGTNKIGVLIDEFVRLRQSGKRVLATDQLLNVIYLIYKGQLSDKQSEQARELLFRGLQD